VLDSHVKDGWPVNYDVVTEKPMSIQTAVSNSTNTVAVKVNMALGASRAYKFLTENLHITSMKPGGDNDENSSSTALGGMHTGISVLEITAAFETFPNGGIYTEPYFYSKVVDSNGKILLEKTPETSVAMSESTASMINLLLRNAVAGGTGSPANFGTTQIAGKTGTTSDSKDRWFVGYTNYYTAAVWYGYDQPTRINYNGVNPAVKAWKTVMSQVHSGLAYKTLTVPNNLVSCEICSESGLLPTELCKKEEKVVSGQFLSGAIPTETCTVHKEEEKPPEEEKEDPKKPKPTPKPEPDPEPEPTPEPEPEPEPIPDPEPTPTPDPQPTPTPTPDPGGSGTEPTPTPDPGGGTEPTPTPGGDSSSESDR